MRPKLIGRFLDAMSGLLGRSYLNHDEILRLCESGAVHGWKPKCVNTASLDLRLGRTILVEARRPYGAQPLDYRARNKMHTQTIVMDHEGFVLLPGQFILAHTIERLYLPDNIAALWRTKSSMGRIGLEHMDAGWIDPGFNGALTLEFCNASQYHPIRIRPGDRVGQLVLMRGRRVSQEHSYRTTGNYNGASGVKQVGFKEAGVELVMTKKEAA